MLQAHVLILEGLHRHQDEVGVSYAHHSLVTRPRDVLAALEVGVAIKFRQFLEVIVVSGAHVEDDHLPVMRVGYVRSSDVVTEVGAVVPNGVVFLGYVRGLARIHRVKLGVGRCVACEPLLALFERLERIVAGEVNCPRRACQGFHPHDVRRVLELL